MNLSFKVSELSFLSLYRTCSDSNTPFTDKFQIVSVDESEDIGFILNASYACMLTVLAGKNTSKEKILLTYSVDQFTNILEFCNADDDIIITDECIKFGVNSKYQFESHDINEVFNITDLQNTIQQMMSGKNICLQETDKINNLLSYSGDSASGFDVIGFFDNHWVMSNQTDGTGIISTGNTTGGVYYFPLILNLIVKSKKLKEICLYTEDEAYYMCKISDTSILMKKPDDQILIEAGKEKEVSLPNILSEEIKKLYEHKNLISISKKTLFTTLSKINIVTNPKYSNRAYISFSKGSIKIDTREELECVEEIKFQVPQELFGVCLVVSLGITLSMLASIDSEDVIIKIPNDPDNMVTVLYTSETGKNMFIQTLNQESHRNEI